MPPCQVAPARRRALDVHLQKPHGVRPQVETQSKTLDLFKRVSVSSAESMRFQLSTRVELVSTFKAAAPHLGGEPLLEPDHQGVTLVHFSSQPELFCPRNHPQLIPHI